MPCASSARSRRTVIPPEVEPAEAFYRQAIVLADELGMRPLLAHCHCGLGILYNRIGRPEQARTELSAAIELYRAMDMTFWLERAEIALVRRSARGESDMPKVMKIAAIRESICGRVGRSRSDVEWIKQTCH